MPLLVRLTRLVAAAIVAGLLALLVVPAAEAGADPSDSAALLALTNQARASRGLPPMSLDSGLTSVAERWAATMASQGVISHNMSLPSQVSGWKLVAENVGVGPTVEAVHQGFLGSPTHLGNIVDPSLTRVGFGFVRTSDRVYVVENFMQPASASAPVAVAAPAPSPSASAAVAPRPTLSNTAAVASRPVPAAGATAATTGSAAPRAVLPAEPSLWLIEAFDTIRSLA